MRTPGNKAADDVAIVSPARSVDHGLAQHGAELTYSFGPFQLYPLRQLLTDDDRPVRLGSRAVAILLALVERPGELLTKEELVERAWPETYVEEVNLRVHVAAVRRALNDSRHDPTYVANVAGRGYRFVARVGRTLPEPTQRDAASRVITAARAADMPVPLTRIVGRDAAVASVTGLLRQGRLVSVVGPGGIGKTSVALVVAHQIAEAFRDDAHFVDLSSISDPQLVPFIVASALKISVDADRPITSLASFVTDKQMLILLDNCEHVIDAAAQVAESLLKAAPEVRILATSHEPLRAEGEWMHRLMPFDIPDSVDGLSLQEAMKHPAVELFVERATSDQDMLVLRDDDVPFIADICRRLDGIPLAIEIAAARAELLGVGELAARLDDRFKLLTGGRRTAVARHRTMRSMLDWSHDNLTEVERVVLRRISIFSGDFGLEGAAMVAGDERLNSFAVTDSIASLVGKSLLFPGRRTDRVTHRMLDSTRLYAIEKLEEVEEVVRARWLHAQYLSTLLERAEAEWKDTPRERWVSNYGFVIDDIRAALAWAFSPTGDRAMGVILTSLAMPLGMQLGLVDEFRGRALTALTRASGQSLRETVAEMRLNIILNSLGGNQSAPSSIAGYERAIILAESTGLDCYRIEPLISLAAFNAAMGDYGEAIANARLAGDLGKALGDDLAVLASNRVLGFACHFIGDHRRAVELARTTLSHPVLHIPLAYGNVQTDRRVSMRSFMSRSLWIQGLADQAMAVADEALDLARDADPLATCQTLMLSVCPILLWRGDDAEARERVATLIEQSTRYTVGHLEAWGRLFEAVLDYRGGSRTGGRVLAAGEMQRQTLATLFERFDSIEITPGDLRDDEGWCAPELLRVRGEQLLAACEPEAVANAEMLFLRAGEIARRHGALAWELRAAMSIGRLRREGPRQGEAAMMLTNIYTRFTEGLTTADLIAAKALIAGLSET